MRNSNKNRAITITFCGVMASLGVVIMLVGSLFGVLTYAAPLFSAVFLIPVLFEFGKGPALMAYAVTAILTALIGPDKELAFFYVFIGYYPVLREVFGRIRLRAARALLKLAFFSASVTAMVLFLVFVYRLEAILEEIGRSGTTAFILLNAFLVAVLMFWDIGLGDAGALYEKRLRPKLGFLK